MFKRKKHYPKLPDASRAEKIRIAPPKPYVPWKVAAESTSDLIDPLDASATMMRPSAPPVSARDFLTGKVNLTKPTAYIFLIAGGALRDSVFNKPIKDIDLFVMSDYGTDPEIHQLGLHVEGSSTGLSVFDEGDLLTHQMLLFKRSSDLLYPPESGFTSWKCVELPLLNLITIQTTRECEWGDTHEKFANHLFKRFPVNISRIACTVEEHPQIFTESSASAAHTAWASVGPRGAAVVWDEGTDVFGEYHKRIRSKYGDWVHYILQTGDFGSPRYKRLSE